MSEHEQLEVVDLGDGHRYELRLDGERVGSADYRVTDGVMTIPYVETKPAHRGKDFAARLMAGVLDDVRARELTVQPTCSYAAAYMRRRPETHDLIAS
jgi:predicted GNAT family acetyltransferase